MQRPTAIKAVMTGDSGVGKSSILQRFSNDEFDEFNEPTLGAAFVSKTISAQQKQIKYQIWDTAGQQKYQAIAPIYYRQSEVALCVYDITDRKSFLNLEKWINLIAENGNSIKMLAIVGNKADKTENEAVTYSEGKQFAQKNNAIFKITSAKDGKGINDLFISLAETYLNWEKLGNLKKIQGKNDDNVKIEESNNPNPEQNSPGKRRRKRDMCCSQS